MKLAVVCASGIGDALIFQTIAHTARRSGWETTTFSNHIAGFGRWLPADVKTSLQPAPQKIEEHLSHFDAVCLQHDNSQKARLIQALKIPVYSFYGAHLKEKHGPFRDEMDYVCDRNKSMVANVEMACLKFFGLKSEGNGFLPPLGLIHKRFKRRIAIHPTASSDEKIWPKENFLIIAETLRNEGYEPVFTVAPFEQPEWRGPIFPTLEDLASFLYESGAFLGNDSGNAHLASLLKIPHLVIAGNGQQMPLWRTGWLPGVMVAPSPWLMQFKYLRDRWKFLISNRNVIKKFKESILRN